MHGVASDIAPRRSPYGATTTPTPTRADVFELIQNDDGESLEALTRSQPRLALASPRFGPLAHVAAVLVGAAVALGVDDAVGAPESDERVQVREGEDRLRGDHPAALHQRALVLAAGRQLRARVRAEPRALHV